MLCQFSFKNYKIFKNEAFLDFMAEPIREHRESLLVDETDGECFIPVIAIYGPNAGGKSTVLDALNFLRRYVLQTVFLTRLRDKSNYELFWKNFSVDTSKTCYHKCDPDCRNLPTSFDVMFRTKRRQFRYSLSLQDGRVVEENLYAQEIGKKDAEVIFERTEEECLLGKTVEDIAVERVNGAMPLLSHIAINYDIEIIDEAVGWFLKTDVIDYDNPRKDRQILIPAAEKERRKMFDILHVLDIQITDIRFVKDADGNILNVYAKHELPNGAAFEIPFEEESSGTRKLFSFLGECISCLEEGNLILADELDAKLHPKLLEYIISLFTNPKSNRNGAQLLMTSHDITTMNPSVFRRDEIWFCARNPVGASKLYSLISFRKENGQQPRNDEVYGKRYLEGRYGADPYIRKILNWEEEEDEPEAQEVQ